MICSSKAPSPEECTEHRFFTKYALSRGIFEATGKPDCFGKGYIQVGTTFYKDGRDCFKTIEEAEADAISRAKKQIAALERKLARLINQGLTSRPKWSKGP